uniref:Protein DETOXIFICATION n=1 Tax=Leersia perrieri TaxID=77586 RepID=A0A0D9VBI9_9ORYZ
MSAHLRLLLLSAAPSPLLPTRPRASSLRRVATTVPSPLPPPVVAPAPAPARARRLLARSRGVAVAGADGGGNELELESESSAAGLWEQVRDIVVFAGPALGLWICGPLMSLIDTMVIGQTSSLQLAALGPGTVFCDYLCYIFMFLSIATSNMVATSLAKKIYGTQVLTAFTGSGNYDIISAANTYAQIRGFAWPAVLVGLVAQSASLGMKDSWGPLKALAAASVINGFGDVLLCSVCGYGIAGAAWATMVSQIVAAFMMMQNLNKRGFRAFSFTIPSASELMQIFEIAAPVFVTMTSKVAFYALLTYSATAMGAITLAAHQVMLNVLVMCTIWGEPLSQTAQSFMPELLYGAKCNLMKARMLLKSLVMIGAITGTTVGAVGTLVPWLFPSLFTNDLMVVQQMHKVLIPYFCAILVTPSVHSLEGTLMAGRDLRFLSQSMGVCFGIGTFLLMGRFGSALQRLLSPTGLLYNEKFHNHQDDEYVKVKAT